MLVCVFYKLHLQKMIRFDCLRQRGFCEKWCQWIEKVVTCGTLSVKVNDKVGAYFKCGKGVRQGDPLSPFLFNIAADTLAKMVTLAQENGLIEGLVLDYIPKGVAILQYTDDTIICLKDSRENAQNMKLLLYLYENMSGLKINFDKSEVIMVSQDPQKTLYFSETFNCAVGDWPIKYLGVPVSGSRIKVANWLPLDEKLLKRLDGWKGGALSMGGRLTLINSSLSSIPTYNMSLYLLPKIIVKRMDRTRKIFFWQAGALKKIPSSQMAENLPPKKKRGPGSSGLEKNEPKPAVQMVVEVGKGRRPMANNSGAEIHEEGLYVSATS